MVMILIIKGTEANFNIKFKMKNQTKFYLSILGISILFSLQVLHALDSEAKGKITGKVIEASTQEPMEFATVSVYSQDSSLITGTITDNNGNFTMEVPNGNYYVVVDFVGFSEKSFAGIEIGSGNRNMDLGDITLQLTTRDLDEVTVRAERSEMVMTLDKRIFTVGKDLTNTGNTAADILENVPSITVDVDGNVELRGSGNVKILIDGKPSGLVNSSSSNFLESLQGSLIDRVEVITNPSVRYEAEGQAGIINIILKKDQRRGMNGSFEVSAGYPEQYSAAANVNFRREKINYFVNYGFDYRERPGDGSSLQTFTFPDTAYKTRVDRDRLRSGWDQNIRGGADFFINDKNTITTSAMLSLENSFNPTDIWYYDYNINDELTERSLRTDEESEDEINAEFSLNYDKEFDKKDQKLTAVIQYVLDTETETSDVIEKTTSLTGENLPGEDPIIQKVNNEEFEANLLIQVDYVHPFDDNSKFEVGYRSEFRRIENPYFVNELDEAGKWVSLKNFTNTFDYNENVHALYAIYGREFNRFSAQAGLRGEYSDISTFFKETDEGSNKKYFNLFPSIHTTYELTKKQSLQLSYSRRINRPGHWYLNPFSNLTDSRNIRTGNPDLDPEFTNSYEFGYLFREKSTSVYSGIYYRRTTDVIDRISEVDTTGVTYFRPKNLAEQQSYGLETNLSVNPFSWWRISGSANFFRFITEGEYKGQDLNADAYSWFARGNSVFKFKNDLQVQLTYFYRGRRETTQGYTEPFYMVNTAMSKDILKGNGTITLNIRDLLNSRKYRFYSEGLNFSSEHEFRWAARSVVLTFIYRLNQKKNMGSGERSGGNNGGGDDMGF